MKYKNHKKAFSLVELVLVLGVGTMASFIKFQDMKNEQDLMKASAAGEQIQRIGYAVNNYIALRYDKLSTLTSSSSQSSDPGPRTCSGNTCVISVQTLKNEGILPNSYVDNNSFRSPYSIVIKRTGSSPNYILDALITTSAAWIESGNNPRYDLLGFAMQKAGVDSGMTKSNTKADGYNGNWSELSSSFSNITKPGQLVFRAGYNASLYSAFLRRDGTLPMTGNLNMGGQNIDNAKNITASGTGSFAGNITSGGTITAAKEVIAHNGYGDVIRIGGDTSNNDYEIYLGTANKPLSLWSSSTGGSPSDANKNNTLLKVSGAIQSGTINSIGEVNANGNITSGKQLIGRNGGGDIFYIGGGDANDYEFRLGSNKPLTLWRAGGLTTEQRFQVWGKQNHIGDFSISGDGNSSGSITASGNIIGGYVKSNGNIDASNRVNVGEFINLQKTATVGASCSPNGLLGRQSNGAALSCVNGVWQSAGTPKVSFYNGGEYSGSQNMGVHTFCTMNYVGNAEDSHYCNVYKSGNNWIRQWHKTGCNSVCLDF